MKKGMIANVVIAVLVIVIIVLAVLLGQNSSKLSKAETMIADLNSNVSTLEGSVSSLQNNVSTLQTDLAASKEKASSLQTNLNKATADINKLQADLRTQQDSNSALSAELQVIKYPKHFVSLTELTDWLQKDDTNTKYSGITPMERAFILEVKALQNGYLLPVRLPMEGLAPYVYNTAVIGEVIYNVRATDDSVDRWGQIQPLPTRPILPP